MQYAFLGKSGMQVSRISLGTMNFAGKSDFAESRAIFNQAREAGVNFIDTANQYTGGQAEEYLGRLLAGCREEFVLASKVGHIAAEGPLGRGLSRRHIMQQIEQSLKRLGTDRLDLYYCHRFDPNTDLAETLEALTDLVKAGKVLCLGVSNWAAWQIAKALGIGQAAGLAAICCMQPMYNLVKRQAEVEMFPLALDAGLAVAAYNPLAAGLLTGRYRMPEEVTQGRLTESAMYAKRYADPVYHQTADRFVDFARERGHTPAALAIAWVLSHPAVTCALAGPRLPEHLDAYVQALDIPMNAELWEEIAALGPPAPVATDRDEERG